MAAESDRRQAVICAIAKDEDPYIDEWVRYNLGLGFHKIYVYDNSYENSLMTLPGRYPEGAVEVVHFPGPTCQMPAYSDFLLQRTGHTWCAFIDVDEFIVLRKHRDIVSFLEEHCRDGAVALNWYLFGSSGHVSYSPEPVLKRFQRRDASPNRHVKCIVCLADMSDIHNPHFPQLESGKPQRDTNGKQFSGPFNDQGPTDVAVLHHYFTKSREEFEKKRARGRADVPGHRWAAEFEIHDMNTVFDSSAWELAQHIDANAMTNRGFERLS
jgi:hypothetical protein